jgi:uncharacterized membrane protein YeaQ/YmgE (transglycosylase-associated protein family)
MLSLLGTVVFGLIVGALAKLVMPGRDPGGILITMLLGVAGSVVGGFIGRLLGFYGAGDAAGFIMSTLGAIALLSVYRMINKRRHA